MSPPEPSSDEEPLPGLLKAYTDNKKKDFRAPSLATPYQNVANYSHSATVVPPYALYGIANNQSTEQQQTHKSKGSRSQADPFILSMNDNWATFFETVDSTPAYADGILTRDAEALGGLADLNGRWGGDKRLKHYLNNEGPPPDPKDFNNSGSGSIYSDKRDYLKSRSKAGYWMSANREEWIPYMRRVLLLNNYVPLFFRVVMISLSIIALALSARIYHVSRRQYLVTDNVTTDISQQPSTIMAISVQSIALAYLGYIAWDEFKSKPLGIRNPVEKMRLILLDLLFIIFSSANLSLSFNTLFDSRWVCVIDTLSNVPKVGAICRYQKALCSFLFVVLVMWVFTFTISIMRVIQKVSSPGAPPQ